jgi:hypothetical protein
MNPDPPEFIFKDDIPVLIIGSISASEPSPSMYKFVPTFNLLPEDPIVNDLTVLYVVLTTTDVITADTEPITVPPDIVQ